MKNKSESSIGRVIVLGTYWTILVYAFGTIFGSMLLTLYSDPPKPDANDAGHHRWCVSELAGLEAELENRVLETLEAAPAGAVATDAWEADWLRSLQRATAACVSDRDPPMAQAYADLARLHVESMGGAQGLLTARRSTGSALDESIRVLSER